METVGAILSDFAAGLSYLGSVSYWGAFLLAVFITVPIALLPGISATLVMAVMIPFIVISVEDPVVGIVMLATLTGIDNTLDSIPSILLGIPGGATQVTFLEGNQLAQRGQAAHTLGAVYAVSAIGGVVGAVVLALVVPIVAPFVLKFQFAEKAAMAIFGVAMVAALSGGALIKGFVAGVLGLLLSTIGPSGLEYRYAFGQDWLQFSRLGPDRNEHWRVRAAGDHRPHDDAQTPCSDGCAYQLQRGVQRSKVRTQPLAHDYPPVALRRLPRRGSGHRQRRRGLDGLRIRHLLDQGQEPVWQGLARWRALRGVRPEFQGGWTGAANARSGYPGRPRMGVRHRCDGCLSVGAWSTDACRARGHHDHDYPEPRTG